MDLGGKPILDKALCFPSGVEIVSRNLSQRYEKKETYGRLTAIKKTWGKHEKQICPMFICQNWG